MLIYLALAAAALLLIAIPLYLRDRRRAELDRRVFAAFDKECWQHFYLGKAHEAELHRRADFESECG